MSREDRQTEKGLTLFELAIAILVTGFLTVAFLQIFEIQERERREEQQNFKIFTIADGLATYLSENGHYPCPGRRDRSTIDDDFSEITDCTDVSVAPGDTGNGYTVTERNGKRIRIGSIPYKDIKVGKEDVIDVYGNQFTYAVIETQASPGLYEEPDVAAVDPREIQLLDVDLTGCDAVTDVCTTATDAPRAVDMVFFTHGETGAGSFTSLGTANLEACSAVLGSGDQENCDNDATFVTEDYAARSSASTGLPDDSLVSSLLDWTYIWDDAPSDSGSIYNRASGNMAVGLDPDDLAAEKLHIARGNLRVETDGDLNVSGKIQSTKICDENGLNCFLPEVIAGADPIDTSGNPIDADADGEDDVHPTRLQCERNGFLMTGTSNGAARCRSIVLESNAVAPCGNFEYANSFSLNPTTGQITLGCVPAFGP